MSDIVQALRRRHYNPLSWLAGLISAAALFAGLWYRDGWTIGIALGCLATCWFWFSPPESEKGYFAHVVKGTQLWQEQRWSWAKLAHVLISLAALSGALVALWLNWLVPAVALVAFVVLYKAWWLNQRVAFSRLHEAWMNQDAKPENRVARYIRVDRRGRTYRTSRS